ncbi:protein MLN51 homolog [Tripterygium wilfordii]|uniref:protein MLN51 homolog n=1 Tax=Tripterygium wilfordii TaxID=458696 RepID=UPI0018F85789|nr:protein MLN51 homolog [Tripterygium wilfordii]XP_038718079.1 protein MLN51 homolog [Tripterygium wilfordii]
MASHGEEELEYDSDPEDAKRSLSMRRREAASDDEEGEREVSEDKHRAPIHSDESDGQGGAADYDEDEDEEYVEDEEEYIEDEEGEEAYEEEEEGIFDGEGEIEEGKERSEERVSTAGAGTGGGANAADVGMENEMQDNVRNVEEVAADVPAGSHVEEEEDKKQSEPFAVPTAGAFYMHDDRFRDNAAGRHRRTYGGRKLWESKDDRKWGHDKFEEMSIQGRHYDEGRRTSRGYRARGKNRGPDHEYGRGNRSKLYNNSNSNQNQPKGVKGRGPRRYEPNTKNSSQSYPTHNRQYGKPVERTSHTSSGKSFTSSSNAEPEPPPARKQVVASSLSSASPPFYPSGASNKDVSLAHKRDLQIGSTSRSNRPTGIDGNFSIQDTNGLLRGKKVANSVGMEKLYIDDSMNVVASKPLPMRPSQSRVQGRGVAVQGQMTYQPLPSSHQVRVSSPMQPHTAQRGTIQNRGQPSVQASGQQLGQRSGSGSQASSPPKTATSMSSYQLGELESSSESNKSKIAVVGKAKGNIQGNGRGSFMYSGAQVMGATGSMAVGCGDQNFPATPTFLPVMQFGGQHPGGIGVPAVGMAFPGYVANSHGLGNSEMTWLPVLAGAAGALGATYCPPYISVDGAYHALPSGQTSSTGSTSKDNNSNKPSHDWKLSQKPEPVDDEFVQRQNKPPRRYSEMNFSQSNS